MSKKEGGYVRVKEPTQLAIRAIAGRIQAKEARVVSADDAIWWMVKTYLPEVAEEIQARSDHQGDEAE